jgi:hypothetical protein
MVVPGSPPSGGSRLPGATVPAYYSPRLGELVILVGRVPWREQDHVVAVAERHELQTSEPDHRGQRDRAFRVSHPGKEAGKRRWHAAFPYLARQLSVFGHEGVLNRRVDAACPFPGW